MTTKGGKTGKPTVGKSLGPGKGTVFPTTRAAQALKRGEMTPQERGAYMSRLAVVPERFKGPALSDKKKKKPLLVKEEIKERQEPVSVPSYYHDPKVETDKFRMGNDYIEQYVENKKQPVSVPSYFHDPKIKDDTEIKLSDQNNFNVNNLNLTQNIDNYGKAAEQLLQVSERMLKDSEVMLEEQSGLQPFERQGSGKIIRDTRTGRKFKPNKRISDKQRQEKELLSSLERLKKLVKKNPTIPTDVIVKNYFTKEEADRIRAFASAYVRELDNI